MLSVKLISTAFFIFSLFAPVAQPKELTIGFAYAPPYADEKTQQGFEVEIIKEALAFMGYQVKPVFFSRKRLVLSFKDPAYGLDGASVGGVNIKDGVDGYYAVRSAPYYDYAITLAKKRIKIRSMKDLKDKRILAFPTASQLTGPEYYKYAVKGNPNYVEKNKQILQPLGLYSGRFDVTFGDGNIFKSYAKEVSNLVDTSQKLKIYFLNTKYYAFSRPVFKSKKIRDEYNLGLKKLKKTGEYQRLFRKYRLIPAPIDHK